MDVAHRFHLGLPLRILLAVGVTALTWLALDAVFAASSASAATLPSASSPAGTDDSLLSGILDPVAPVVTTVDGHVETLTAPVPAAEPVRVAEVIYAVDTTAAEVMAAVPVVETVVAPVLSTLVEPVAQPVLESVVAEVAAPVLDTVVSPVVDEVVAPVTATVVGPIVGTVVAPVAGTVATPVVDAAQAPVASPGVDPAVTPIATPLGSAAPTADAPPTPVVVPTNPVFGARAAVASPSFGVGEAAAVPTLTVAPQPAAPTVPFGIPPSPVALPAPAGGLTTGSGSGNGPLSATSTPSGLLPAPVVRFHSSPTASDELPLAPSFDPGSTPD